MRHPLRVVLTGSESTGKSTLARVLALHFGVPLAEEFARRYAEEHSGALTMDDVEPIALGQIANETEAERIADETGARFVVFDTDLQSTVVYSRHYFGTCPHSVVQEARGRVAELYLLCDIDVPWRADGIRDRAGDRVSVQRLFRTHLESEGAYVADIRGSESERRAQALSAIESRFVAPA